MCYVSIRRMVFVLTIVESEWVIVLCVVCTTAYNYRIPVSSFCFVFVHRQLPAERTTRNNKKSEHSDIGSISQGRRIFVRWNIATPIVILKLRQFFTYIACGTNIIMLTIHRQPNATEHTFDKNSADSYASNSLTFLPRIVYMNIKIFNGKIYTFLYSYTFRACS